MRQPRAAAEGQDCPVSCCCYRGWQSSRALSPRLRMGCQRAGLGIALCGHPLPQGAHKGRGEESVAWPGQPGKIGRWRNKTLLSSSMLMTVRLDRMASLSQQRLTKFIRGISVRQVRLASGLVLFAYLVSHFLNHALGNISMDALATGVSYHVAFWQFPPVGIVFYASALVHTGLGIWALYERRQFSWKAIEPLQLVLGLSIPALIITHIVGVRLGQALFGHEKLYPQVFFAYWIVWPLKAWLMYAVITIAWVHGCIGLYFWLRMRAFFKTAAPFLLAVAVLIPPLAMLGLYQGGRSVVDNDSVEWRAENLAPDKVGTWDEQAVLSDIEDYFLIGYLGLLVLVLLAKGARAIHERR